MKTNYLNPVALMRKVGVVMLAAFFLTGILSVLPGEIGITGSASAACLPTPPPTTYGQVTQSVTVATAGSYRVWSRIKAPDTTANSYYFQADGGCAYNVGDAASIPANTWTWVNYQDGSTAAVIDLTLTAGSHTLTYTGKEANVQLDRVLLLTDKSCVPTGLGDNCAVNDATGPTTTLTAPAAGATVSGATVPVTATAADASGVKQVDFIIDNVTVASDTTSPYSYTWNTTALANGSSHTVKVTAIDNSPNGGNSTTTSAITVTVNNADTQAPTGVSLTAPTAGTSVQVGTVMTMTGAATDNTGVTKMDFIVDGVVKNTDTAAPYSYAWDTAGTSIGTHSLTVKAYDAANNSTTSAAVSVSVTAIPVGNGDVNSDQRVNALDLSLLISHDGQNYPAADFNHDGTVGAADMAILISKWTW